MIFFQDTRHTRNVEIGVKHSSNRQKNRTIKTRNPKSMSVYREKITKIKGE